MRQSKVSVDDKILCRIHALLGVALVLLMAGSFLALRREPGQDILGLPEVVSIDCQIAHMRPAKSLRRVRTEVEAAEQAPAETFQCSIQILLLSSMDAAQRDLELQDTMRSAVDCLVIKLMVFDCDARHSVNADAIAHDGPGIAELDIVDGDGTLQFKRCIAVASLRRAKNQCARLRVIGFDKGAQDTGERCARNIGHTFFVAQDMDVLVILPLCSAARADEQWCIEDELTFRDNLRRYAFLFHSTSAPFPAPAAALRP